MHSQNHMFHFIDEDPLDLSVDEHTNTDKDVISYTQNVAEGKKFGKKNVKLLQVDSSSSPFYMAMDITAQKKEMKAVEAQLADVDEKDVDDTDMLMLAAEVNKALSEDEQKAIQEARNELLKPEKVNDVQIESEKKTKESEGSQGIEDKMVEILDQSSQEISEKYQNASQNATAAADQKAELDEKVAASIHIHELSMNQTSQEIKDQKALNEHTKAALAQQAEEEEQREREEAEKKKREAEEKEMADKERAEAIA